MTKPDLESAARALLKAWEQNVSADDLEPEIDALQEALDTPRVVNAPGRIYLVCGDLSDETGEIEFDDLHEVGWSQHRLFAHDIEYRRVDGP